jgi:RimJ/RimL family protein N-acetyltransferase
MIRSIKSDEIEAFCGLAGDPERLRERLARMFEKGICSPDYCHVWTEDGRFVAGASYVNFPASPGDFGLWNVFGLTEPNGLAASAQFLQQSLRLLARVKAERIEADVSSLDDDAAERRALLVACGFRTLQVKARYEFDLAGTPIAEKFDLHFEPFGKLGSDKFIRLISEATRGTLDRSQRAEWMRLGGMAWAKTFFDLLLDIDRNQSCWNAAIIDGQAVGIVIPQIIAPEVGAINYVGVVPAYRGKGISRDLLKVGTADLIRAGIHRVIADIDVENYPLAKSLAQIGYVNTSELVCYQLEIESMTDHD